MNKKGYSVWEEIIVLSLIAIFVGVIYHKYEILQKKAIECKLKVELKNLRLAIILYRIKQKKNPKSLYELYEKGYIYYKEGFYIDKQKKQLLDELKHAFIYDNKTGSVRLNPETLRYLK